MVTPWPRKLRTLWPEPPAFARVLGLVAVNQACSWLEGNAAIPSTPSDEPGTRIQKATSQGEPFSSYGRRLRGNRIRRLGPSGTKPPEGGPAIGCSPGGTGRMERLLLQWCSHRLR